MAAQPATRPRSGLQLDSDRAFQRQRTDLRVVGKQDRHVARPALPKAQELGRDLKLDEWQKDLRVTAVTTLALLIALSLVERPASWPLAGEPPIVVALAITAPLFLLGRWFSLIVGAVGALAWLLAGILPPLVTSIQVGIHDAAPQLFRWRWIALVWAAVLGALALKG